MSAVLHMDETTPHIHATVVPIVRGERRKAVQQQAKNSGKRTYRKKKDAPRLCADDVMSRPKLKEYQNTYAERMAGYGLQRGIDGSEAKHITGSQFYKKVFAQQNTIKERVAELVEQKETLSVDIATLQAQQTEAQADCHATDKQRRKKQEELQKTDAELKATLGQLKTEKLKNSAAEVGTTIIDGIGAMIGTSKVKRQEQQIAGLRQEVAARDESIELLQQTIQTERADYGREKAVLKQETNTIRNALAHVHELFPHIEGLMRWENYCRSTGLNKAWTKALFSLKPYRFTGELHSVRYNQAFTANDVILQFKPDKDGPGGFQFTINGKEDDEWFRQQRKEFYEQIGIDIEQTGRKRGHGI